MRSVLRALAVLRELNANAGYLAVDEQAQRLRLTPLVKHLSDGYEEDAWITEIAGPVLEQLQRTVIWPTDLFSLFDDTMVMRRTTRRSSPWTFDRVMLGFRMPVLVTACGRACMAHLPDEAAESLLMRLLASAGPEQGPLQQPDEVRRILRQVRADGYALRGPEFMKETGSIAVPVFVNGEVVCAIAITYIFSAISQAEVVRRFAPLLKQAARDIEASVSFGQQARP
ncbi:MAG TPA: IclR family transcriptional regulator C-terminal domain-containing protein [Ramlibacter sp.]|nr:IclR family transcriptional regulator C-terminal domain-containing protein [Ramlibacter sp.]